MSPRLLLLPLAALLAGCAPSTNDQAKADILAADRAFCAKAVKDGPLAAFEAFAAPDAKLLSSFKQGKAAIVETFNRFPPTASLTWDSSFVDVAASGDLGYTWGRYTLLAPSSRKGVPPLVRKGNYVTVWRKVGGAWKVVLDGGNADGT